MNVWVPFCVYQTVSFYVWGPLWPSLEWPSSYGGLWGQGYKNFLQKCHSWFLSDQTSVVASGRTGGGAGADSPVCRGQPVTKIEVGLEVGEELGQGGSSSHQVSPGTVRTEQDTGQSKGANEGQRPRSTGEQDTRETQESEGGSRTRMSAVRSWSGTSGTGGALGRPRLS